MKRRIKVNFQFPGNRISGIRSGEQYVEIETLEGSSRPQPPPGSQYPNLDKMEGEFPWFHMTIEERKEKQKTCEHISWYKCNQHCDSDYWQSWSCQLMSNQLWLKCFDCGLLIQFLFDNYTIHYQE